MIMFFLCGGYSGSAVVWALLVGVVRNGIGRVGCFTCHNVSGYITLLHYNGQWGDIIGMMMSDTQWTPPYRRSSVTRARFVTCTRPAIASLIIAWMCTQIVGSCPARCLVLVTFNHIPNDPTKHWSCASPRWPRILCPLLSPLMLQCTPAVFILWPLTSSGARLLPNYELCISDSRWSHCSALSVLVCNCYSHYILAWKQ